MNKYLEKIAEFEKEANNPETIVKRLMTRGKGTQKGYADELSSLGSKMGKKYKEHKGKLGLSNMPSENQRLFDRMSKIDSSLSRIDTKDVGRWSRRGSSPEQAGTGATGPAMKSSK